MWMSSVCRNMQLARRNNTSSNLPDNSIKTKLNINQSIVPCHSTSDHHTGCQAHTRLPWTAGNLALIACNVPRQKPKSSRDMVSTRTTLQGTGTENNAKHMPSDTLK